MNVTINNSFVENTYRPVILVNATDALTSTFIKQFDAYKTQGGKRPAIRFIHPDVINFFRRVKQIDISTLDDTTLISFLKSFHNIRIEFISLLKSIALQPSMKYDRDALIEYQMNYFSLYLHIQLL